MAGSVHSVQTPVQHAIYGLDSVRSRPMTECPLCHQPLTITPTADRPEPLPDARDELLARLAGSGELTAASYARHLYGDAYTISQLERARAKLRAAVDAGVLVTEIPPRTPGQMGGQRMVYLPASARQLTTDRAVELVTEGADTVQTAAERWHGRSPSRSEVERMRRRLNAAVTDGRLTVGTVARQYGAVAVYAPHP